MYNEIKSNASQKDLPTRLASLPITLIFLRRVRLYRIFFSLVFIFNSRDELMTNENHEKVPNFESIEIDDGEDLIQLSNFYKTNTPKEKF